MPFIIDMGVSETAYLISGILMGGGVAFWWGNAQRRREQNRHHDILAEAQREAETIRREARLHANEEVLKLRQDTEASFATRRTQLVADEKRLIQKESLADSRLESARELERRLQKKQQEITETEAKLQHRLQELNGLENRRREEISRVANLPYEEARKQILREVEEEVQKDAAFLSRRILDETRRRAEAQAKKILCTAIQRYSGEYTFESTTATINLPGDEIKGRIIGREGRNIRAFEAATGITVLIDDTPGAVVLSGFDPVRREIAREAMQRLITDGRIHPTRIEEVVDKVRTEIDERISEAGSEAVAKVGLPPLPPDVVHQLGRLRFRLSYSQNILDHSVEVAHLCGLIAAELGLDVGEAKRAGLLHDIGKAIHHEFEGAHAQVGAEFLQKFGLSQKVVNGVASHHNEVESISPLGIIVSSADAISASRPGARSETLTTYLKRLSNLERLGTGFPGVDKCYAVHAGRELRVLVQAEKVNDEQAQILARKISRKIEEELQYPGQIRVTVIRETRCIEYAK